MKKYILTLLVAFLPLLAFAQKEQDFATRFIDLYGDTYEITATTVSPLMIERILELPNVEDNDDLHQILTQLKSIRMLTNNRATEASTLYNNAQQLAKNNNKRYKLYAEYSNKQLYIRKRNNTIVEVILIMQQNSQFCLINLTGNMTEKFIDEVIKS